MTGEKTDHLPTGLEEDLWMVMMVAVLVIGSGLAPLVAAYRKTIALELAVFAMSGNVGLSAIDVIYTSRRVILPIYLVDAVVEIVRLIAWSITLFALRGKLFSTDPEPCSA